MKTEKVTEPYDLIQVRTKTVIKVCNTGRHVHTCMQTTNSKEDLQLLFSYLLFDSFTIRKYINLT